MRNIGSVLKLLPGHTFGDIRSSNFIISFKKVLAISHNQIKYLQQFPYTKFKCSWETYLCNHKHCLFAYVGGLHNQNYGTRFGARLTEHEELIDHEIVNVSVNVH